MRNVTIGSVEVSRLCMGGNPFSGFSHQSDARTKEMLAYYTPEKIKETLRKAEQAGINTVFARTDEHIYGIIKDYWKEGGKLQWFAQVATPKEDPESWRDWIRRVLELGASGTYMHGGVGDFWYGQGRFELFHEAVEIMRKHGSKAIGMAGHRPDVHAWMRDNLKLDFQMCSYYNPTDRTQSAHHVSVGEKWTDDDRNAMLAFIPTVKKPVVHYKVLAGGNLAGVESFKRLGKTVRANDVICLGIFLGDDPDLITKDIALIDKYVEVNFKD